MTKCPHCNGTGDMPYEYAVYCFERDGVWPMQRYGCVECDGLGEVEEEDCGHEI